MQKSIRLSFNQTIESSIKDSKLIYYPKVEAIIKEMTLETFQRALSPPKKQNRNQASSEMSRQECVKTLLQDGFIKLPQVQTLILGQTENLVEELLASSLVNITKTAFDGTNQTLESVTVPKNISRQQLYLETTRSKDTYHPIKSNELSNL